MSNKYELVIFWSEEDRAFMVEVPELPGCPIPQPRGRLMYT
jgi:predicted RNase H-like HicB family nuclease